MESKGLDLTLTLTPLVNEHNHSRRWRMYTDERNTYDTSRCTQDFILGLVWRSGKYSDWLHRVAWVRILLRDSFLTKLDLTLTLTYGTRFFTNQSNPNPNPNTYDVSHRQLRSNLHMNLSSLLP